MESEDLSERYEEHHKKSRAPGFSILKDERGAYFSRVIGSGKRVLDLGCRDGALTQAFLKGNEVLGVDVDKEAMRRAEALGIKTAFMDLMGDWNEIGDGKFDAIVAGELLEHVFYPERLIAKAREHLSPGGIFVGSVPNAYSLKNRLRYLHGTRRNTPLADPTHITQFSAQELAEKLGISFAEVTVDGLGRYPRLAHLSPNWFAFDLVFVARA